MIWIEKGFVVVCWRDFFFIIILSQLTAVDLRGGEALGVPKAVSPPRAPPLRPRGTGCCPRCGQSACCGQAALHTLAFCGLAALHTLAFCGLVALHTLAFCGLAALHTSFFTDRLCCILLFYGQTAASSRFRRAFAVGEQLVRQFSSTEVQHTTAKRAQRRGFLGGACGLRNFELAPPKGFLSLQTETKLQLNSTIKTILQSSYIKNDNPH